MDGWWVDEWMSGWRWGRCGTCLFWEGVGSLLPGVIQVKLDV